MVSSSAEPVDSILVLASVSVPTKDAVPDAAVAVATRIHARPDGRVVVHLGAIEVETNDNALRQEQLADAVTTLWAQYTAAGFDPLPSEGVEAVLSLALTPEWGQAASAIEAQALRPWMEAGAELHITAYQPETLRSELEELRGETRR